VLLKDNEQPLYMMEIELIEVEAVEGRQVWLIKDLSIAVGGDKRWQQLVP